MSRLRGPPHRGVRRISPNLRPDDLPPPIHPITLARHDIPLGMLLPRRLLVGTALLFGAVVALDRCERQQRPNCCLFVS